MIYIDKICISFKEVTWFIHSNFVMLRSAHRALQYLLILSYQYSIYQPIFQILNPQSKQFIKEWFNLSKQHTLVIKHIPSTDTHNTHIYTWVCVTVCNCDYTYIYIYTCMYAFILWGSTQRIFIHICDLSIETRLSTPRNEAKSEGIAN